MATTVTVVVNGINDTTKKKYTKTFKEIPENRIGEVADAKTFASNYVKVVDTTYTGGEYREVTPFEA